MSIIGIKIDDSEYRLRYGRNAYVLDGQSNEAFLNVIEAMIAKDFSNSMPCNDGYKGLSLYDKDIIVLFDNNSALVGHKRIVREQGNTLVPKIHCIRCFKDGTINSFLLSDTVNDNDIAIDTTKYSNKLSVNAWSRIIETTNKVLGYRAIDVDFNTKKLIFGFKEIEGCSIKSQQSVFLLIAECFVTPLEFSRVFLISNINNMASFYQAKLLDCLSGLTKNGLIFSSGYIKPSDISDNSKITIMKLND